MTDDRTFLSRLEALHSQAAMLRTLVVDELAYKRVTTSTKPTFALDLDVIYEYLVPIPITGYVGPVDADARHLVETLLVRSDVYLTVLPGSIYELDRVLTYLTSRLATSVSSAPWLSHSSDLKSLSRDSAMEVLDSARIAAVAARRARELFRAPNWIDASVTFANFDERGSISDFAEACFTILSSRRPATATPHYDRRISQNRIDSANLALTARAIRAGTPLTLVTRSGHVRAAFGAACHDRAETSLTAAVLAPRVALFRLALSGAAVGDVSNILAELNALEAPLTSYRAYLEENGAPTLVDLPLSRISIAEQRMAQLVSRLVDLEVAAIRAWTPTYGIAATELDLSQLAECAKQAVAEARREILALRDHALAALQSGLRLLPSFVQDVATTEFDPATRSATLFQVDNFVLLAQGGSVTNVNVTAGRDITATNSFNITSSAVPNASMLNAAFAQFATAVEAADLDAGAKTEVLERTSEVAKDVERHRGLPSHARDIWFGVKEVVKTTPAAIAAWEAVSKLLGL